MSKDEKNNSVLANIVAFVIVAAVFIGLVILVKGWLFPNKANTDIKKEQKTEQKVEEKDGPGSDFSNPIKIKEDEITGMNAKDFQNKYNGKWVEFDATLVSTVDLGGMLKLQTGIYPFNKNFKDGAFASMSATQRTFDSDLQDFSEVYKAESESIKAHVVGRVARFDKDKNRLYLDSNPNIDGNKPSITSIE